MTETVQTTWVTPHFSGVVMFEIRKLFFVYVIFGLKQIFLSLGCCGSKVQCTCAMCPSDPQS